jgi:hypothetical protein
MGFICAPSPRPLLRKKELETITKCCEKLRLVDFDPDSLKLEEVDAISKLSSEISKHATRLLEITQIICTLVIDRGSVHKDRIKRIKALNGFPLLIPDKARICIVQCHSQFYGLLNVIGL